MSSRDFSHLFITGMSLNLLKQLLLLSQPFGGRYLCRAFSVSQTQWTLAHLALRV